MVYGDNKTKLRERNFLDRLVHLAGGATAIAAVFALALQETMNIGSIWLNLAIGALGLVLCLLSRITATPRCEEER